MRRHDIAQRSHVELLVVTREQQRVWHPVAGQPLSLPRHTTAVFRNARVSCGRVRDQNTLPYASP